MQKLLCLVAVVLSGFGTMPSQDSKPPRYPNELPGYRFYQTAKWKSLTPLVSTMADVRRVMGNPDEANDLSEYREPYPGDAAAKRPVFMYRPNRAWEVLIYFAASCSRPVPLDVPGDRLWSIDIIPRRHVSFRAVRFSSNFTKRHVKAVDAAWDEYSDGTGLRYEVYTTKTPYGGDIPGDLNRISYGPPESISSPDSRSDR